MYTSMYLTDIKTPSSNSFNLPTYNNLLLYYQFLSTIKAMNISTRWFLIDENFLINIYHRLIHNYNKEENDTGILVYPDIMSNFMVKK